MPPLNLTSTNVRLQLSLPTEGWHVVWIAFATILPWTIVTVFDAIDSRYRRVRTVTLRLLLATGCNIVAYVFGSLFVVQLVNAANAKNAGIDCRTDRSKCDYDRFDEIATFLVLLLFNVWFVMRNVRGWLQFLSLWRLRPLFVKMQKGFAAAAAPTFPPKPTSVIRPPSGRRTFTTMEDLPMKHPSALVEGISQIRISDRLINNDLDTPTPLLNPLKLRGHDWELAGWRAWWTQDCRNARRIEADPNYDVTVCANRAQDLPAEGPRWPLNPQEEVLHPTDHGIIPRGDREAWLAALVTYGNAEGQQDTRGQINEELFHVYDRTGVATLVKEKTRFPPHRMSSLWYATSRFEDVYGATAAEINDHRASTLMPSSFVMWKELAAEIAKKLDEPMYLSGDSLCVYAGELAATSILLSHYPYEYRSLVERVYQDGRSARWTFGWSGLLSCFSNLWTRQRVFLAMLNGLSLLAIKSANSVAEIEPFVRAMMVGYASFAVSDRAVGKRIAQARKAELLQRYLSNRGKTCRGSGLCATRMACRILKIPAEASHMDGLPAFSTGWANEYMLAQPGSQKPEYGGTHNEVEEREGSSNAWRYPDSRV